MSVVNIVIKAYIMDRRRPLQVTRDYTEIYIYDVQCMYVYHTHDYIRMEVTVLYLKFNGINCRFNGHKYSFTGSANMKIKFVL